jgi:predicted transposase/invertase (TIGR01784 family)
MKFLDIKTDFAFKKVFGSAGSKEANLSEEELELQHKKRDWIYIQKSSIEFATKAGLEQGEWNAKIQIIENAQRMGLPMQTIVELTGIDEQKILFLLSKNTQ